MYLPHTSFLCVCTTRNTSHISQHLTICHGYRYLIHAQAAHARDPGQARLHSGAAARFPASPLLSHGLPLPELSPLALLSSSSDSVPYEVVRCQDSPPLGPVSPTQQGGEGQSPHTPPSSSVGRKAPWLSQPLSLNPVALCRRIGEPILSLEQWFRDLGARRRPGAAVSVSSHLLGTGGGWLHRAPRWLPWTGPVPGGQMVPVSQALREPRPLGLLSRIGGSYLPANPFQNVLWRKVPVPPHLQNVL